MWRNCRDMADEAGGLSTDVRYMEKTLFKRLLNPAYPEKLRISHSACIGMKRWLFAGLLTCAVTGIVSAKDMRSVVEEISRNPEIRQLDEAGRSAYCAAQVRKAYQGDEARIVREALAYNPDQEGSAEQVFLMFWNQLNIGRQARLALIEALVAPGNPSMRKRAWYLLGLSDMKLKPGEPGSSTADLTGHAGWVGDVESMPQEYLLYLFKQDGTQTWMLLGGKSAGSPVLGKLAGIIAESNSSFEKGKKWLNEIKPELRNGEAVTTSRDAAYLAWFLGMIYGSDEKVRKNNPEIAAVIDRMIPGLGGELMKGVMGGVGGVKQTPAPVAVEWIAKMRKKVK